jgi:PAS domain S-box-containing protein
MNPEMVKILIVDDSQNNLQKMLNCLFSGGYLNVLCATSGTDALRIVQIELPHLIIIDWDMPVMSGIAVLKNLKENPATKLIPVIIATGAMLSSRDMEEALISGAIDYIRKPFDQTELLARVKSGLDFSSILQTIETQKQKIEQQNFILEENEKRLTAILNASNEAYVFIENDIIIEADQLFCNFTGFPREEIIGQSFFHFFPPRFRKILIDLENLDSNHMPIALLHKRGDNLPVEMMVKRTDFRNKNVLAASFLNLGQFSHRLNEELTGEFLHDEVIINKLNAEIQALRDENIALLNQLQYKTLQSARCNDSMNELSKSLSDILILVPAEKIRLLEGIEKCINHLKQNINDGIWNEFRLRFAELHTNFYDKLLNLFPALTENDLRLCAFIKLKMSTKEIATIINQPVNSVKVARNRLRSKLHIEDNSEPLLNFLASF